MFKVDATVVVVGGARISDTRLEPLKGHGQLRYLDPCNPDVSDAGFHGATRQLSSPERCRRKAHSRLRTFPDQFGGQPVRPLP